MEFFYGKRQDVGKLEEKYAQFYEIWNGHCQIYSRIKHTWRLCRDILSACVAQSIHQDATYQMVWAAAHDSTLSLLNLWRAIGKDLRRLQAGHFTGLDVLKRNNWKHYSSRNIGDAGADKMLSNEDRRYFISFYDNFFPNVVKRNGYRPRPEDLGAAMAPIDKTLVPLKLFRDKAIAHWDRKSVGLCLEASQIDTAYEQVEEFLASILLIAFLQNREFALGGIAEDTERSAAKIAAFVCGTSHVP